MFIKQNYRIYPTKSQQKILNEWIGCGRFIWNYMLNLNIKTYNETGKFVFYNEMANMLPKMKKTSDYIWLKETPSQGLQQKVQDLDTAIKGCPKFKSKKFDESGIRFHDFKIQGKKLYLPKIKSPIKIIIDRELLGKPGLITVKKDKIDNYYISITIDVGNTYDIIPDITNIISPIGIDIGVKTFAVTTDGELIENPKFLRKQEKKLAKTQRKHNKKIIGSNNREKSRYKLAKLHKKIANQRKDFIKQNAVMIAKLHDFVAVENLNVKGMIKNHKLAKSIIDVSFGSFISELQWQCKKRGKFFYKIDRWFPSSKTCCNCGNIKEDLTLNDRIYVCPKCNHTMDRDLNASINILIKGLNDNNIQIPQELRKYTPTRYYEETLVSSE